MKTLILTMLACLLILGCNAQQLIQEYKKTNGKWIATGEPYAVVDSPQIIHGYAWKNNDIVAVQDFKRINGKYVKYGEPYALPDTVTVIRALPWKKKSIK